MKSSLFVFFALSMVLFAACDHVAPTETAEMPQDSSKEEMMESGNAVDVEVAVVSEDAEVTAKSAYMDFDEAAYDEALAAGKTVFLDFHADWCGTCVSNAPKIEAAFDSLGDENIVGFKVNYDDSDALQAEYGVTSQSTLVVVPGADKSAARSMMGLVSEDDVREFVQGA